jgi:hypothetical protein
MKKHLVTIASLLSGIVLSFVISPAAADITFTFTKSLSGGVDVVGFGTGRVDRALGIASNDWDVNNFLTDYLKDSYTDDDTPADSVSGTFTNVTSGISEGIESFDIDRDSDGTGDDLDWDTFNTLSFAFDDEFLFQMTASFDPGTLMFSDLILGTHIDEGHTAGAGLAEESFGLTIVQVVPEPNSIALLFASIASIGLVGRRRI